MNNSAYTPFFNGWMGFDIVLWCVLGIGSTAMMGISTVNMQANLIESGMGVFIEAPYKAWMISSIAPITSIAIKLVPMAFEYPQTKILYYKVQYIVTALTGIVWIILVAQTFDGLGSDISLDDMFEQTDNNGTLYVFVQLFLEILLSASLFSAWSTLHEKYQPKKPSPEATKLRQQIVLLDKQISQKTAQTLAAKRNVEAHKRECDVFTNKNLEALALLRAKHVFLHNFFGDKS